MEKPTTELEKGRKYFLDGTKEETGIFVKYEINGTPLFEGLSNYYLSNDEGLIPIKSAEGFTPVYTSAVKAGRCFNGAHRDGGTIIHAIPNEDVNGANFSKSLCGATPGRRGYGWNDNTAKPVNCLKCLNKLTPKH